MEKEKGDFLKKLKESLETGKENQDVSGLHYEILEKAKLVKINQPEFPTLKSQIENIKKDSENIIPPTQARRELEKHAEALNKLLDIENTDKKIIVTASGNVVPKNSSSAKTLIEIKLLEDEIKILEATIDKNRTLIDFLKLQIKE